MAKKQPKKPSRKAIEPAQDNRVPEPSKEELDGYRFMLDKTPFTFELNGHFCAGENSDLPVGRYNHGETIERLSQHIRSSIGLFSSRLRQKDDDGDYKEYTALVDGHPELERVRGSCLMTCYYCGEEVEFLVNLKTRHVVIEEKCRHAGGLDEYAVSFDVPSGKLVFANDLRDYYQVNDSYDINRTVGIKRTTEAYAAHGMFHAFLGNTCPGIYQKDNRIAIGSPRYSEDADADGSYDKQRKNHHDHGKRRGGICTDLWWFCAADYNDLKSRAGDDFDRLIKDHYTTVVTVKPGHYRLTARNHVLHREEARLDLARSDVFRLGRALDPAERKKAETAKSSGDTMFFERSYLDIANLCLVSVDELNTRLEAAKATLELELANAPAFELRSIIERVGDCTGVNEHAVAEAKNQEAPTFEDYVKICRLAYPTMYPNRQRVLEHTFLVVGNGMNWNKGTLYTTSEKMESARARLAAGAALPPETERPQSYYPISEGYSAITTVPDDVRHDWLAAAFEACIMVFRTDPDCDDGTRSNAKNIELAHKVYNQLYERFDEKLEVEKEHPDGTVEYRRIGDYREELDPVWPWLQSRLTYPEMVQKFRDLGWTPEKGRPKGAKKVYGQRLFPQ